MTSELYDIIIPSIAFFVAFFMVFVLVELTIILFLNILIFKYWGFAINVVIRATVKHGKKIKGFTIAFVAIFIFALILFTSFMDILWHANFGAKILAAEMFFAMALIYITTTKKLPIFHFMKTIHKYLFVYMSAVVYIFVVVMVNQHYESYQNYINANITHPISKKANIFMENQKRKRLLKEFRQQIYAHNCPRTNMAQYLEGGAVEGFVYVATHDDLKIIDRLIDPTDLADYLIGRLCANEEAAFLLTDHGEWYWVIDDSIRDASIT